MYYEKNIPLTFAGIDKPLEKCKVVILPVPYDATATFKSGAREGPYAIILASRQFEDYDLELKREIGNEIGIYTAQEIEPHSNSPYEMIKRIEKSVNWVLNLNKFPVVIGGEHTVSIGAISAISKKKKISVLQIDAHADLRDVYQSSKYNHACVMRRIREMKNIESVVQVGIRSLSIEEAHFIEKNKIEDYIYENTFDIEKILKQLGEEVYITIDLDGFDPSIIPSVGTPEPNGLKWEQTLNLLKEIAKNKKIVGFDVVELSPIPDLKMSDMAAAKLIHKLIGYSFLLK